MAVRRSLSLMHYEWIKLNIYLPGSISPPLIPIFTELPRR
jgi:hypothetical protein